MAKIIRIFDLDNAYLKTYDPDGGDPDAAYPTGEMTVTRDPGEALRFVDAASAWNFWRQTSTRSPLRPDGKPNRPLTAFTVSIEDAPDTL